MVADEFYGGIPQYENIWNSGLYFTATGKKTYIFLLKFRTSSTSGDVSFHVHGNLVDTKRNPNEKEVVVYSGEGVVKQDSDQCDCLFELKAGTRVYVDCDPNGTPRCEYELVLAELPSSGSRTRN